MSHEVLSVVAAGVLALSPVERAMALFLEAMEQHRIKPPNLKWQRQMAEMDRLRQRRRIRKVIERHRRNWKRTRK